MNKEKTIELLVISPPETVSVSSRCPSRLFSAMCSRVIHRQHVVGGVLMPFFDCSYPFVLPVAYELESQLFSQPCPLQTPTRLCLFPHNPLLSRSVTWCSVTGPFPFSNRTLT